MHTTPPEAVILKQDVLGRVRRSACQRERLLDEFERSGLSGRKFAALAGVNYQTFATWAQRRRQQRGVYPVPKAPAKPTTPMRWLEAVVTPAHDAKVKTHPAGLVVTNFFVVIKTAEVVSRGFWDFARAPIVFCGRTTALGS